MLRETGGKYLHDLFTPEAIKQLTASKDVKKSFSHTPGYSIEGDITPGFLGSSFVR
jgi:hypothetical protein